MRIKNWNSCVPEEVRKSTEFMPIYPFERMVFPRRFVSPFLTKLKGSKLRFPGGIGESVERACRDLAREAKRAKGRDYSDAALQSWFERIRGARYSVDLFT